MDGRLLRNIGLGILIAGDTAAIIILGILQQWWWFAFFLTVTMVVIVYEIASYIAGGLTISNRYKQFRKDNPVWSAVVLIAFTIAMLGLTLHLWVEW